jgi:hypothetical protein
LEVTYQIVKEQGSQPLSAIDADKASPNEKSHPAARVAKATGFRLRSATIIRIGRGESTAEAQNYFGHFLGRMFG